MSETATPSRARLVAAAVLVTVLAVAVAVIGMTMSPMGANSSGGAAQKPGPLPLVSIPAPQAQAPECTSLLKAAPDTLESGKMELKRRQLAEPAPPAALAWGRDPVVLRCGLERPAELKPSSSLRQINGVQWLQVSGRGTTTWYVVDREVYAALTVPAGAGTGPLQHISDTLAETLPQAPLRFE